MYEEGNQCGLVEWEYEPISNSVRDVNFDEIGEGDLGLNIEWTMEMSMEFWGGLEVSYVLQ